MEVKLERAKFVRVKNHGGTFDSYRSMAEKLNATRWESGALPKDGEIVMIKEWAPHHVNSKTVVVLVKSLKTGREYLIGSYALQETELSETSGHCVSIW